MPQELRPDVPSTEHEGDGDTVVAGTPVVVRRRLGLAALIGVAASAVAIAYLWRATQTMAVLDWGLCAVMTVLAGYYLTSMIDSRTPLVVADDLGVRIRLGHEWRGLPWEAIEQVVVHPRRGLLRDGRIIFVPESLGRALDGVDGKARQHALLNQKLYGAALAVPLGVTTRIPGSGERSVVDSISALSLGRAEVIEVAPVAPVVEVDPSPEASGEASPEAFVEDASPVEVERQLPVEPAVDPVSDGGLGDASAAEVAREDAETDAADPVTVHDSEDERPVRPSILGGIGTIVSRVAKGRRRDVDASAAAVVALVDEVGASGSEDSGRDGASGVPLRSTRHALRADVTRDAPATLGNTALDPAADDTRGSLPEGRELRRPGSVDLVIEPMASVRPISTPGDPVEPLVIDDFVPEPAYDPVIGPDLAAARTRLGISVDELAERTRIRPHVIESIEVDDFAPCGGDFYARGHLRTLARVLGKDVEPLLERFEERYAAAPINARRVFEAELATGMTGSMRSTVGGPNWGLLVGVVLTLVLVWGVVRLFASEPAELISDPAPILNGSAGIAGGYDAPVQAAPIVEPLPVTLVAAHGDTQVVVRDGSGEIVFTGEMVLGEKKRLGVAPPVRVRAADAGALEVQVSGQDRGVLGVLGEPGRRTFH